MTAPRTAFTVRHGDPDLLGKHCRRLGLRAVVVSDPEHRAVVVFPALPEDTSFHDLVAHAADFSKDLDAPVLATSRGVPSVLWLGLFQAGDLLLDDDSAVWELPWTDDARFLARELGVPAKWPTLRFALKSRWLLFDRHRHWLILKTLELPTWIAQHSYATLASGPTDLHRPGLRVEQI